MIIFVGCVLNGDDSTPCVFFDLSLIFLRRIVDSAHVIGMVTGGCLVVPSDMPWFFQIALVGSSLIYGQVASTKYGIETVARGDLKCRRIILT
jgi:hypothetical protein